MYLIGYYRSDFMSERMKKIASNWFQNWIHSNRYIAAINTLSSLLGSSAWWMFSWSAIVSKSFRYMITLIDLGHNDALLRNIPFKWYIHQAKGYIQLKRRFDWIIFMNHLTLYSFNQIFHLGPFHKSWPFPRSVGAMSVDLWMPWVFIPFMVRNFFGF